MIRTVVSLVALLAGAMPALASPRFDTQPVRTPSEQEAYDARIANFCRDAGLLMAELDEQRHSRIETVDPRNRHLIAFLHELNCRRNPDAFVNAYLLAVQEYQMSFR